MGTTTRFSGETAANQNGAQVAELVDAQVSGTCGRKAVEVRVFSWAPNTLPRGRRESIVDRIASG